LELVWLQHSPTLQTKKLKAEFSHEIKFSTYLSRKCEMQMRADGYSYYLNKTIYLKKKRSQPVGIMERTDLCYPSPFRKSVTKEFGDNLRIKTIAGGNNPHRL
jgi:hypothetical protein